MLRWLPISTLAACGFSLAGSATGPTDAPPSDAVRDAPPNDAPTDSSVDGPPAAACYGSFTRICLVTIPTTQLDVNAVLPINTDSSTLCRATANGTEVDACVLAATSVTVNARLEASGSRPLVLLAVTGDVSINGVVDVSSRRSTDARGAGSLLTCAGGTAASAGTGGAGGSFLSPGGSGGGGGGGAPTATVALPQPLRGGCPGGAGGGNANSGGLGGGAVDLIALGTVTINGQVLASGAGGRGGGGAAAANPQGGGGGGAGGTIWLDAPNAVINDSGRLAAQGGGGGQGSLPPVPGANGSDLLIAGTAAGGGSNGASGGAGGAGGVSASGETGGTVTGVVTSGGGGGGGAGSVRSADPTTTNTGMSSPPLTN